MTTTFLRLGAALTIAALAAACAATTSAAPASAATAEADAGRLMLVMDASGSMGERLPGGGTKIAAARAALHDVAGSLPDTQPVGLRVFGAKESKASGNACSDSQRVVDLATGDRTALDSAIDRVQPFGETPIGYALQQAGKDLGAAGRRTVVLVSDGEPTCTPDPCAVAADLVRSGVDLRVDVVGLAVSGAARSKLQCIADRGEGRYYDADSAADLAGVLQTAAVRAAVPFRTSGKPVRGRNTRVDAPLVGDGDWTDTLGGVGGDRQTLYYTVHRDEADSTLHVSVDTLQSTENDVIGIALLDAEGNTCGSAYDSGSGGGTDPLINASVSIPRTLDAADLQCAAAGDFVVQVDHGFHNSTSTGRRADVPIELRVREEPAVKDVQSLPETLDTPTWSDPDMTSTPVKTAGGDSLNAATLLKAGTYSGSLATGDVQSFAVDVGYGQSLAAALRVSVSPLLATKLSTGGWPALSIKVYSPSRVDADGAYAFRSSADDHSRGGGSVYQGSDGTVYYEYTNTVSYRNRFQTARDLVGASEAGRYLVVVSLAQRADAQRVVVPFVMGLAVRGDVSGAPGYSTTGGAVTDGDDQQAGGGPAQQAGTGQQDRASGPIDLVRQTVAVGAIGLGVLALLGAGVLLVVLLLRRRTAGS